ncbi:MAG: hypothetical protein WC683_07855 [bacterium]|jgi:hypothetical protein
MEISIVALVGFAVVATVGTIQHVKGYFRNAPTWVWRALLALVAVAWGLAIGQTWLLRVLIAGMILTLAEAGYVVIVQKLPEVAGRLADKLG